MKLSQIPFSSPNSSCREIMSHQGSLAQANDVSSKHVRMNARYLMEFFKALYGSDKFLSMNNTRRLRNFVRAVERIKSLCANLKMFERQARSPSVPVQKIRTVISPKPSQTEQAQISTIELDDTEFFDVSNPGEQPCFNNSPDVTLIHRSPRRQQSESPRTPEQQTIPNPQSYQNAPVRPSASRRPQQTDRTPVRRPETRAQRGNRATLPAMGIQSPKRRYPTSTPRTMLGKSPIFQIIVSSPNESRIEKLQCDQNMTNKEIEKIGDIVANISAKDGADVFDNGSVSVSTRNVNIVPGKYKLYKAVRM